VSDRSTNKEYVTTAGLLETEMPISLFICEERPAVQLGLSYPASATPDLTIVGYGAWNGETLSRLRTTQPDHLLFELMGKSKIPGQIARLREACKNTKLMAMTREGNLEDAIFAIDCGVEGLLKKGCTVTEIISAILMLDLHGTYLDPETALQIVGRLDTSDARRKKTMALQLTALEEEVIQNMLEGISNLQIAQRLQVSERTIIDCVGTLKEKFGVTRRLELVLSAKNLAQ
jgi:DNA-binding NarL/FixJ family response regulator